MSLQQTPLLKRAIYEAIFLAPSSIDRCIGTACGTLEEAERLGGSITQRQLVSDALHALNAKRGHFKARFPGQVEDAIRDALARAEEQRGAPPTSSAPLSDTSTAQHAPPHTPGGPAPQASVQETVALALLDEQQMAHFVESSRLQQTVLPAVEQTLGRLDTLISSVMDLPAVRPDLNPMRPEILCNTLLAMLEALDQPRPVVELWLRHMARPYAQELNTLYEAIGRLLQDQGVQEARYRVRLSVVGGSGGAHGSPSHHALGSDPAEHGGHGTASGLSGAPGMPGARGGPGGDGAPAPVQPAPLAVPPVADLARAAIAVPHALVYDFLYQPQWVQANDMPLPPGYYTAVQREMAALPPSDPQALQQAWAATRLMQAQRREQVPVDRVPQTVATHAPLDPERWGAYAEPQARAQALMQLKSEATQLSQVLGLDAVRALVEQVAHDTRVLPPVREAFIALEPALLRLAMADPRFFANEEHPARRLIEAVAQRSFKFNDEFSDAFEQFMEPVRLSFRQLLDAQTQDPHAFGDVLAVLEDTWRSEDEHEQQARDKGVRSIEFAQERQKIADRIAWEFSLRPDLANTPGPVSDFLFESWSLVIAHAQLTDTRAQLDPGGFLAIVSDLLWSVKRELTLENPARLFEIVPSLLQTLRRGLDLLGKPASETQGFFDALMRYHLPVLELRRVRSQLDAHGGQADDGPIKLPKLTEADKPRSKPEPRPAETPWLGEHELGEAGFEGEPTTVLPTVAGGLPATDASAAAQPADAPADDAADPDDDGPQRALLGRLRRGDWVDLLAHGKWRRAKLVWSNDSGALYMFISAGGRPHTMTRRSCLRLLQQRHLRPVEAGEVVEQAVNRLHPPSAEPSARRAGAARR